MGAETDSNFKTVAGNGDGRGVTRISRRKPAKCRTA
jgi:hypothetical protein